MSKLHDLYRLSEDQVDAASKVCARAFQDYPQMSYYFPNPSERENQLPIFLKHAVRYGLLYGEVYISSPNLEGVAVWLPFWEAEFTYEREEQSGLKEVISTIGGEWVERSLTIETYYRRYHKRFANFPHCYLYMIAVDPEYQGMGFASTLLRAKLMEIDELKLPCYLETYTEKNADIYQHFGFEVVKEGIIRGTDLGIWAMLRKVE